MKTSESRTVKLAFCVFFILCFIHRTVATPQLQLLCFTTVPYNFFSIFFRFFSLFCTIIILVDSLKQSKPDSDGVAKLIQLYQNRCLSDRVVKNRRRLRPEFGGTNNIVWPAYPETFGAKFSNDLFYTKICLFLQPRFLITIFSHYSKNIVGA